MTDTEVKVNGQPAGEIHQGAFYAFKYDITKLLKYGKENLLEVTVAKHSANASVNEAERKADFWIFGGIFRPVYLKVSADNIFENISIDAKANGDFFAEVRELGWYYDVTLDVFNANGKKVSSFWSGGCEHMDCFFKGKFKISKAHSTTFWTDVSRDEDPYNRDQEIQLFLLLLRQTENEIT